MKWVLIIISAAWFPHSLNRVNALGYDFPIYYNAALDIDSGWFYADWVRYVFYPLTFVPMDVGFAIWYSILVLTWIALSRQMGAVLTLLSVYPMLLCLELGQITPILAWLCLTPLGGVLAGGVKPYLFGFVLLHIYALSRSQRKYDDSSVLEAEHPLSVNYSNNLRLS